jgi:hypothetical protein
MRRTLIALFLAHFLFPAHSVIAEESRYSFSDLQALEKAKSWDELLLHLEDIPEENRGDRWDKLAEKAGKQYLAGLSGDGDPFATLSAAEELFRRHAFLRRYEAVREARLKVAMGAMDSCFGLSNISACSDRLFAFVRDEKGGSELAFRAGKLIARSAYSAGAVDFFERFLSGRRERIECADEDVVRSTLSALALPTESAAVPHAREIASDRCAEAMRPYLMEALEKSSKRDLTHNLCVALKKGGASLGKSARKCREDRG